MSNSIAERIAAEYAAALADDRAEDLIALFGDHPCFQSPFSVWDTPPHRPGGVPGANDGLRRRHGGPCPGR
jgi:hypothetical protein